MKHKRPSKVRVAVLGVCALGAVLLVGCGHTENATQSPQQIKSAMGGHYSPSQLAQAQAFRQQEMQSQAQMAQKMQGKTSGNGPVPANGVPPHP